MLMKIDRFSGMNVRIAPHLLSPEVATHAVNCKFVSGKLVPLKALSAAITPDPITKVGTIKTIFRYVESGDKWFHWLEDVDVIRGPIPQDATFRVYYTGENGEQRWTDQTRYAAGGGTNYPTAYWSMGLPAPAVAPTAVPTGPAPSGEADTTTYSYVYTWQLISGDESPPSPPITLDVGDAQYVTLSNLDISIDSGTHNPTGFHLNIYRTASGSNATDYHYIGQTTVSTFLDQVDLGGGNYEVISNIGEILTSTLYDKPPSDMFGLVTMPNGICVGFSKNDVCFSEPYLPHAWPVTSRITLDYDIIGGGVFGNSLLVITEGTPYLISGTDPSSMTSQKLEVFQAGVSKRSIVDIGENIIYASPDGLIGMGQNGVKNLSEEIISSEQWKALAPANLSAWQHEEYYIGFLAAQGIMFSPTQRSFSYLDFVCTAGFNDLVTDTLYVIDNAGNLKTWEGGASYLTATWKSKLFIAPQPTSMAAAQVEADSYNAITFKLYVDGVLRHTETVTDNNPFRLPVSTFGTRFQVEITTTDPISRVLMGTTMAELKNG